MTETALTVDLNNLKEKIKLAVKQLSTIIKI